MSIMELEELCIQLGIRPEDLNETVRRLKWKEADEINASGFEMQLPIILTCLGHNHAERIIREIR